MKTITIHQDCTPPISGYHSAQSTVGYRVMGSMGEGFKPFHIYSTSFREEAEALAQMVASRPGNAGQTVIIKSYY